MRQNSQPETLNGSTALVLYHLGRLEEKAENTERTVLRIEADMQRLTQRLDSLEAKASPLDRLKDLSGFLTALAVVILAVAGKYDLIGYLVQSGR